jgi:hypothetical protein
MSLPESITLSRKATATVDSFPEFFEPVLNALYDLHLKHGYRKPQMSIYRDESTVIFKGKNHSISISYLTGGQLVLGDSRKKSPEREEIISMAHDELATKLPKVLKSRFKSLVTAGDKST